MRAGDNLPTSGTRLPMGASPPDASHRLPSDPALDRHCSPTTRDKDAVIRATAMKQITSETAARQTLFTNANQRVFKTEVLHELDEENCEAWSDEMVAKYAGSLSVDTDFVRDSDRDDCGQEFVRANVSFREREGDNVHRTFYRVDRDVRLLPECGWSGNFVNDVLPYIVPGSVRINVYKPTAAGLAKGKHEYRNISWRWDTDKLADSHCPLKLSDISLLRDRVDMSNAERGFETASSLTLMSAEEQEELAALFA